MPHLILISTGSEVQICTPSADLLEAEGIARVVSMPCVKHFADREYRERVLPSQYRARVSLEAAGPLGWHRWVGDVGEAIGAETFGAWAPAGALYKRFGFTSGRVAERGRATVKRAKEAGSG